MKLVTGGAVLLIFFAILARAGNGAPLMFFGGAVLVVVAVVGFFAFLNLFSEDNETKSQSNYTGETHDNSEPWEWWKTATRPEYIRQTYAAPATPAEKEGATSQTCGPFRPVKPGTCPNCKPSGNSFWSQTFGGGSTQETPKTKTQAKQDPPKAGQASIDKVAGPVGEALIMTAIGLAVAVPAVLGYNWLLRRNKALLEEVRYFATDIQQYLVSGARVESAQAAGAVRSK